MSTTTTSTRTTTASTHLRRIAAVATVVGLLSGAGLVVRHAAGAEAAQTPTGTATHTGVVPGLGSTTSTVGSQAVEPAARMRRSDSSSRDDALQGKEIINLTPLTSPIGAVIPPRSSMSNFLDASYADVWRTFRTKFNARGLATPNVRRYWPAPGERVRTSCGVSDDTSFFYCGADDTIVISQAGARDLWNGRSGRLSITGTGDMSVSLFVAHEFGHNLVAELGYRPSAAMNERAADCFAGVWAADAGRRGILEQGDVMEAWQALDLFAEHAGQSDNGVHGTPAMRQRAFSIGWYYGINGCTSTYLTA